MPTLIKHRKLATAADTWTLLQEGEAFPACGDVIVPLSLWLGKREVLLKRVGRTGVWLKPEEEPALLAPDFAVLPLIAVHFPAFTDGRGYSTARLLRERYQYKGELRAIGAVLKDTLLGMARCGFDSLLLRDGETVDEALTAFAELADFYQANAIEAQPLFRRRNSVKGAGA